MICSELCRFFFMKVLSALTGCKNSHTTWISFWGQVTQFGGMKADEMKRLKELEKENARLKKIVADQAVVT